MLNYIKFAFLRHDSVLHRMDALSKLIVVVLVSVSVYFYNQPIQLLPLFLLLFFMALILGKVRPLVVCCSFAVFVLFGGFVAFFQLLTHQGGDLLTTLWIIKITTQGLNLAELFVLRLATIGAAALVFLWTTNPRQFVVGLIHMKVPYRFAFAVLVALRFLPLIQEEISKIRDAQAIRGVKNERGFKGLWQRWQRYMFPVLLNGLRKSETTGMAMDSRAFGLYENRTYVDEFRWSTSGRVLVVLVLVMAITIGYVWGFGFIQPRYS